MPVPTTLGTDMSRVDSALRVGVAEAPTASATALASSTATATLFIATLNAGQGLINCSVTTNLAWSLVVTNSVVSSGDIVWVQPQAGTNTQSGLQLSAGIVTVANGTFSVVMNNVNSTAHNGSTVVAFQVQKLVSKYAVD